MTSLDGLEAIVEAAVIRPGDKLVIGTRHDLSPQEADRLKRRVREELPGVELVIASSIDRLMVYRPGEETGLMFRLWSNKHGMWWKPWARGYTSDVDEAGLYTEAEAVRRVVQSAYHGHVAQVTCMVVAPDAVHDRIGGSSVPSCADLLQRAATVLRDRLNAEKTPYFDYQRLMLDLDWPVAVARWLETVTETDEAALDVARAILKTQQWTRRRHGDPR